MKEGEDEGSTLDIESFEVFENIAYIMAKHADPENEPDNPDDDSQLNVTENIDQGIHYFSAADVAKSLGLDPDKININIDYE